MLLFGGIGRAWGKERRSRGRKYHGQRCSCSGVPSAPGGRVTTVRCLFCGGCGSPTQVPTADERGALLGATVVEFERQFVCGPARSWAARRVIRAAQPRPITS